MILWLRSVAPALGNHLWQSTAFAAVVWVATLASRKNQARVRYSLWLAASVKFLVPFALLVALGGMLPKQHQVVAAPAIFITMDEVTQPFADVEYAPVAAPVMSWKERVEMRLPLVAASVWLCGAVAVLVVWGARWRQVSRALARAEQVESGREFELLRRMEQALGMAARVRLRMSPEWMEPGVFGFSLSCAVLMWPEGLSERLDDEHIEAILIHELTHVRRRDNLTAALHMLVQTAFWFHPLVWWMERRMVEERERACDEAVVAVGSRPGVYAESLLKAVRFCVESPLTCVAGITGADLNRRVRSIMTLRLKKLGVVGKIALAMAAIVVIAGPIVLGQAKAAHRMMLAAVKAAPMPFRVAARAMVPLEETQATNEIAELQSPAQTGLMADATSPSRDSGNGAEFDVAVIRPADPNAKDGGTTGSWVNASGRFEGHQTTLQGLIRFAYSDWMSADEVAGGPDWAQHERFDVEAKVDEADLKNWAGLTDLQRRALVQPMMRKLLAQRFHLKLHSETKIKDVFALVQVKGGAKLKEVAPPPPVADEAAQQQAIKDSMAKKSARPVPGSFMMNGEGWSGTSIPIGMLSMEIGANAHLGAPLVDQTGLRGYYDFTMKVSHDEDAPPLIDQIQTDLGLKVEPRKLPIKVYVIDSADKPSVDGAEVVATAAQVQEAVTPSVLRPEFLVATVKPNMSGCCTSSRATTDEMMLTNQTLKNLVVMAYGVQPKQVTGPDWMEKARFDITAKYPPDTKYAERWTMLRTLLEDRFKLSAHNERREMQGYSLVVAKSGFKLKPSDAGEPVTIGPSDGPVWSLKARRVPLSALTWELSDGLGQVVVDQTGLKGTYDFQLRCSTGEASSPDVATGEVLPSCFTALEETLGLRLQHGNVNAQMIVVDHAERAPTQN